MLLSGTKKARACRNVELNFVSASQLLLASVVSLCFTAWSFTSAVIPFIFYLFFVLFLWGREGRGLLEEFLNYRKSGKTVFMGAATLSAQPHRSINIVEAPFFF